MCHNASPQNSVSTRAHEQTAPSASEAEAVGREASASPPGIVNRSPPAAVKKLINTGDPCRWVRASAGRTTAASVAAPAPSAVGRPCRGYLRPAANLRVCYLCAGTRKWADWREDPAPLGWCWCSLLGAWRACAEHQTQGRLLRGLRSILCWGVCRLHTCMLNSAPAHHSLIF